MKEVGAVIGGEGNGGVIYPELHYGRDALVGVALFLTYLAQTGLRMTALRATYPAYYASKNKIALTPAIDVDKVLREIKDRYAVTGERYRRRENRFRGELGTPAQVQYRADHPHLYRGTVDGRSRCAGAAVHRRTARNLQPVKRHTIMEKVLDYIRSHRDAFVEELFEVLRIRRSARRRNTAGIWCAVPNIWRQRSSRPVRPRRGDAHRGESGGLRREDRRPQGQNGAGLRHYDVMPVDPREEWTTEPFEPVVRDGRIWGRGADDDKGSRSCTSRRSRRCARPDNCPAT